MYGGVTNRNEYLLDFVEYNAELPPEEIAFYDGKLSPLASAIVIAISPDGEMKACNAVYGVLPNKVYVICVMDAPFPTDWYDGAYETRIILEPFTEVDEYVVDDVEFVLLEES